MNLTRRVATCIAFAFLLSAGTITFAQDAPPIDLNSMLRELNELQGKQKENLTRNRAQLVQNLSTAAQSAEKSLDLYFEAVMAMNFEGMNRENTMFKEWKDKEKEKWSSKQFETALRFYLYYMAISVRKGANEPNATLMPQLIGYCRDYLAARDLVKDQDIMKKPLSTFIIANYLQISQLLPKGEDWEQAPGNIDGIFEKSVLPYWREMKSPYLIDYWDRKMADEAADSEESGLDSAATKFNLLRRPSLMWSRSQEYFALGQNNRAITEMFAIIKAYPSHPQFGNWVAALKEKIAPPAPAPAAPEQQPAGTTPPAPAQ